MGTLSCYFFLLDGKQFSAFLKPLDPFSESIQNQMVVSFRDATRSTMLASLVAAITQATIVAITFLMLGIPSIALAAGSTFIMAWIPVLGSFPVFLIAGVWLVSLGAWLKVFILIAMAVVTGVSDNVVRPLVLKGGSDMHLLVSLVAILGGVECFGLLGVVMGPVLVSLFLTFAKIWPLLSSSTDAK